MKESNYLLSHENWVLTKQKQSLETKLALSERKIEKLIKMICDIFAVDNINHSSMPSFIKDEIKEIEEME